MSCPSCNKSILQMHDISRCEGCGLKCCPPCLTLLSGYKELCFPCAQMSQGVVSNTAKLLETAKREKHKNDPCVVFIFFLACAMSMVLWGPLFWRLPFPSESYTRHMVNHDVLMVACAGVGGALISLVPSFSQRFRLDNFSYYYD